MSDEPGEDPVPEVRAPASLEGPSVEPVETSRLRPVLAVVAVVLLITAGVGGYFVYDEREDRAATVDRAETYGDAIAAADTVATALVNIDFQDVDASIEAVREASTGEFSEQYGESSDAVRAVVVQNESVSTGEVVWSGISDIDDDSARAFVYTTGTVANLASQGRPSARNFRMQIDLSRVEGEWLASAVEFLPDA